MENSRTAYEEPVLPLPLDDPHDPTKLLPIQSCFTELLVEM